MTKRTKELQKYVMKLFRGGGSYWTPAELRKLVYEERLSEHRRKK